MHVERQAVEAIVTTLMQVFSQQQYADKVIEHTLSEYPYWDLKRKECYVTDVYNVLRFHRKLETALGDMRSRDAQTYAWQLWGAMTLLLGEKPMPSWSEFEGLSLEVLNSNLSMASDAQKLSYPDWLWERGLNELADKWPNVAHALNQPAKTYLRTNTLKTDVAALQKSLRKLNIETQQIADSDALEITQYGPLFKSDAFQNGWFEMQDAGSQKVATLLDVKPGQRVVDACAGAGGKSLHIAALMQNKGYVLSMDIHQHKLDTLKKRAKRAGIHTLETRVIKNSKTVKRLKDKFDRVLLDVPCSGTGVLRRNPDAKWHLNNESIDNLVILQAEILQRYSQMCKPGGRLVYATCSVLPSENEQQIAQFLAVNEHFKLLEAQSLLPGYSSDYDGFYIAVLERLPV
ncbi:16S rRNA (cytosine967-C5)-methyltransferase [Pseudoalteromonas citrea]|uniref:16S rRNA (Cytosine967-C5)-methyltransferase n=2 Tax=Pseudoalteromonas citrea TaxID=43655 RepID=A0AAD4FPM1_9GAMM|nr:RsmB/NOP family class I SAM-dependent RNA methyltransferase [Pseudoalteromonas citrea]KAF7764133.1 16S rRNA (cytosine967-C5)-methyltransferase [Pseudoalteromonas citrea]